MTDAASTPRKYHEKEAFVTGHHGTTVHEILILCLVVPVGLHLYFRLRFWLDARRRRPRWREGRSRPGDGRDSSLHGLSVEFASILAPMLLSQTSLLPYVKGPLVLLAGMLALAEILPRPRDHVSQKSSRQDLNSQQSKENMLKILQNNASKPAFLSIHRSSVYLLTTIAILAVDFPLFPRRFCKTETEGYGWMDLGAASFIVIAGLTSPSSEFLAWKSSASKSSDGKNGKQSNSLVQISMWKLLKKCTPLLLLGLIRLATNKGLEYQEHVSEYGVHWNFFFTLCCVEGCMVLWKGFKSQFSPKTSFGMMRGRQPRQGLVGKLPLDSMLALGMMIPYQIYLTYGGGQEFIENGERRCSGMIAYSWLCNSFVANREGILGVLGYLSLRLISEDLARHCLWSNSATIMNMNIKASDENKKEEVATLTSEDMARMRHLRLQSMSKILWAMHFAFVHGMGIPTSRRSTNVPFIFWTLAHNITILFCIHLVVTRAPTNEDGVEATTSFAPKLLNAVNRFGLAVFLVSNIFTGLVNLTVDTLRSSDLKALVVLSIYLALVCGIALLLDRILQKKKMH